MRPSLEWWPWTPEAQACIWSLPSIGVYTACSAHRPLFSLTPPPRNTRINPGSSEEHLVGPETQALPKLCLGYFVLLSEPWWESWPASSSPRRSSWEHHIATVIIFSSQPRQLCGCLKRYFRAICLCPEDMWASFPGAHEGSSLSCCQRPASTAQGAPRPTLSLEEFSKARLLFKVLEASWVTPATHLPCHLFTPSPTRKTEHSSLYSENLENSGTGRGGRRGQSYEILLENPAPLICPHPFSLFYAKGSPKSQEHRISRPARAVGIHPAVVIYLLMKAVNAERSLRARTILFIIIGV